MSPLSLMTRSPAMDEESMAEVRRFYDVLARVLFVAAIVAVTATAIWLWS